MVEVVAGMRRFNLGAEVLVDFLHGGRVSATHDRLRMVLVGVARSNGMMDLLFDGLLNFG